MDIVVGNDSKERRFRGRLCLGTAARKWFKTDQDGLWVRLSLAIGTPGNFSVAFHTGEDLHFVGMVAGLGGMTEQVHLSAAGWARGPIFDAKRTRLPHANWVFG
jgi:hypothetical protein